jgi:PAS domain S-box-containing protein
MRYMRVTLPLLRIQPARAPILRYGVAVLSTTLALIPSLLLPNITESRLAVFAVAVMVSAWYGGWKPGLVATSFALTVSAYFSFSGERTPAQFRSTMIRLALFVVLAALICWFNGALRAAQEGLRRSEMNFRSLVTDAPYGICRCDSAGQLLDVNPALLAMLGYSSARDLLRQHLGELYLDTHQWFELADYLHSAAAFNGLIAEWKRKDGIGTVVRVSGRAVSDSDDETGTAFELFAEDVTERRALEQQLRQSQKMEAVGRLAGGIAHDFNNLLMVISGYSEFLLDRLGPDPALRGPAQEISGAAQRASSLTRQLLAFSRKQMMAPKTLDLNEVVTENLKMLTRVIGEDIELVMIPAATLGAIRADAGQIDQVIMNLAVNARDAMPSGGKLTIETSNISLDEEYSRFHAPLRPGDYVMLSISDTGMGMDTETQSHIFEPFFTTKGTKGTGLGLSTVYGIVKQSGGYIWVYSESGKGTAFKIYLPRVPERAETQAVVATAQPAVTEPGTETILLVEDESNLRYLARQFLEKQGYRVIEAADGAVAMQISVAHEGMIHLLLTDVIMPGMNGRELAQRISEIRPNTKVLYMSGYTENVIGHNGTLDAGVRLLQKPFTLRELKSKVREVLDSTPIGSEVEMSVRAAHASPEKGPGKSLSRAPRFQLHLPLKYRRLDEEKWHDGETRNISRSGLLFQAEASLQPNVQLEINLVLPAEIAGLSPTEVVCRGQIVRTVKSAGEQMPPALAAKILQYHFQHGSQIPRA